MTHVLTEKQQIWMWIENVRKQVREGNIDAALQFLDTLTGDLEKHFRGELIGPITIHTGSDLLIQHFEGGQ